MEKLFVLILLLIQASITSAQIGKGTWLMGGNTGFSVQKTDDNLSAGGSRSKEFIFAPTVGRAVRQNFILGIGANYGRTWSPNEDDQTKAYAHGFGAFLFVRKYAILGKGFFLFAEPSLYYFEREQRLSGMQIVRNSDVWNTGLTVYPGVAYAANKWLHLELSMNQLVGINYQGIKSFSQSPGIAAQWSEDDSWSVGVNANNSAFTIGARIVLAK